MTEFTKGPWESIVGSTCGRDVISPNSPKTKRRVAACGGPNRDANAHLIAAAPELYEALDGLIGEIKDYHVSSSVLDAIETSISALAKARGEA